MLLVNLLFKPLQPLLPPIGLLHISSVILVYRFVDQFQRLASRIFLKLSTSAWTSRWERLMIEKRTIFPSNTWSIMSDRGRPVPSMRSWKVNSSRGSISPLLAFRSHSSRRLCEKTKNAMIVDSEFPPRRDLPAGWLFKMIDKEDIRSMERSHRWKRVVLMDKRGR